MESLVNKCKRKINLCSTKYVRSMMKEIHWNNRLIAIRGAKGVGKTTLMLQYLKINGIDYKTQLYVSLDDAYFTQHTLPEFIETFYQRGGKHIFIDEVHKYQGWSRDIKNIYDDYPDLKVVISGSSMLNILNGEADLSRRCIAYEIQGLSFREYLLMKHKIELPLVALDELLANPNATCDAVCAKCRPLAYFDEYLERGYYPFFTEGEEDYLQRIENVVEYIINQELPQLCGIEVSAIRKLQSLLAVIASNVPLQVDITKLSSMIETSRNTTVTYLQHLGRARLLNLLYSDESSIKRLQKPDKIYLENPNFMEALSLGGVNQGTRRETFLVGQLKYNHRVEYAKSGDFVIDGKYTIEVGGKSKDGKQIASLDNAFIAADGIEYASGNKIPLWAFGLCY